VIVGIKVCNGNDGSAALLELQLCVYASLRLRHAIVLVTSFQIDMLYRVKVFCEPSKE
jgi:hypothetical protein